ncbi:hypothetical protein P3602_24565 [Vibrio parahaemolyticus]|nr:MULTISPECIES: hypothetical protein [Vibrio]MDF5109070.1 hypothetical protein [Vibrio parahaemolyticus]MCA2420917.1 hypothetical protein [Vibrio alginolyticus]MCA2445692.1 hypothetical protein [Vibrio alginolyticus]MDF5143992.1 hypothetical protein [Vibrio parahaemolyticus]MDF5154419.1 hypothetical protein [Vibrio parahaemolyticus]
MKIKVLAMLFVIIVGSNVYASSNESFIDRIMNYGNVLPKPLAEIDNEYLNGHLSTIVEQGLNLKDELFDRFQ